ncbi:MAG: type 4a pilus biogenesis protein PilO [Xanthomonadaceae bacterium]|jgi:type IV pilus assembly protein PilO|nr:type 4a pilus biogenesis protein PilO [Xanthomonadaceae bacterium]
MAKNNFKLSDINNLDFNNTGAWPIQAKVGACVLSAILVVVLGWAVVIRDKTTTLEGLVAQEQTLKSDFEAKAGQAAKLEPLKAQLLQMETMLKQMLRQLPSKTEMPDLIVDISQTALATGISTDLFQPGVEAAKDFYAEQPITLEMSGTYHQFGSFVSGVASLPRVVIMTFHDISLTPKPAEQGRPPPPPGTLHLKGTIKTYRYLDDAEVAAREAASNATPQGGSVPAATAPQGGA